MPVCGGTGQKCCRGALIQYDTSFAVWQVTQSTFVALLYTVNKNNIGAYLELIVVRKK